MKFRIGYELRFRFPLPTPVIMMLGVHPSRVADLEKPDTIATRPLVPITAYLDSFGNRCSRMLAPLGEMSVSTDTVVNNTGVLDPVALGAMQVRVEHLPHDALQFLLGSRYCDSDLLHDLAWKHFGHGVRPVTWCRRRVAALRGRSP